jgi:hypothetical protein
LTVSNAGQGKTTAQMRTANTFLDAGWDFVGETANGTEDIWRISEGRDYPRLSWERVLEDDFEDGEAGPLWLAYEPDASKIWMQEKGGRLEVHAVAIGGGSDGTALEAGDAWLDDLIISSGTLVLAEPDDPDNSDD